MTRSLRKYHYIFQTHWQAALEYRAELFLWALFHAIPLTSMLLLWSSVYRGGDSLPGYDLASLVTYYVLGYLIGRFIVTNIELDYMEEIRDGSISRYFTKPISLKKYMITQELSWRCLNFFLVAIPSIMFMSLFLPRFIPIPSLNKFIAITILLLLAFTINMLISLLITGVAFFIDQGRTITHLKWMLEGIFNGSLLPLSLYPDFLEKVARLLPFQLQYSAPLELYLDKVSFSSTINVLTIGVVWIVGLGLLVKFVWGKALRHFTAVGN